MPDLAAVALASRVSVTPPAAAAWRTLPALAVDSYSQAVSSDGTRIYVSHNGAVASTAALTIDAAGTVTALPPSPSGTVRGNAAAAWCNGRHYVITGFNGSTYYQTTEAYTPAGTNGAAGTWTTLANVPTNGQGYASAAAIGTFVYFAGGSNNSGTVQAGVYRYDTVAGTWATVAPLPAARYRGAMVAMGGKLYYLAGVDASGNGTSTVYVYDPAANTWSTGPALPASTFDHSATAVGSLIIVQFPGAASYLFDGSAWRTLASLTTSHGSFTGLTTLGTAAYLIGGVQTPRVLDTIDVGGIIDAAVPGWSTLTTLASTGPLYGFACSTDGSTIYTSHGYRSTANVPTNLAQSITAAGVRADLPTAPAGGARWGVAGVFANGKHYAIGGTNADPTNVTTVDVFTPGSPGVWSAAAPLPAALRTVSAAVIGTAIYVAGGSTNISNPGNPTAALYRFETTTGTWTTLTSMPAARHRGVMVAVGTKLYYLCGYDSANNNTQTTYVYDTAAGSWTTGANVPSGPIGPAATVVGTNVYLIHSDVGQTYVLDTVTGTWSTTTPDAPAAGQLASAVAIGSTLYLLGGNNTANVVTRTIGALSPFGRRVRLLQQFLLAVGLPVAAAAARRIPTTIVQPAWSFPSSNLDANGQRYWHAASSDGTTVYVSQGVATQNSSIQNGLVAINPVTGVATVGPGSNQNRYYVGGAFVAGKHYAVGGYTAAGTTINLVEAYTPAGAAGASGTWAVVAALPQSRTSPAVCAQGGLLWSIGGSGTTGGSGAATEVYSYNPATNTWTQRGTTPVPIYGAAAVGIGGFIYLLGGNNSTAPLTSIYRYDVSANSWTLLPAVLLVAGNTRAGAIGTTIYALTNNSTTVSVLNTLTGQVSTGVPTLLPHGSDPTFVAVGSTLSLSGGSGNGAFVERIDYTASVNYPPAVTALRSLVAAGV